jgi:hypothetical protein
MVKVCAPKSQNASQFVAGFDGTFAPSANLRSMPRKPIELPSAVARAFVTCACPKSNPDIFVMQSAEDGAAKNTPCPLYGAR